MISLMFAKFLHKNTAFLLLIYLVFDTIITDLKIMSIENIDFFGKSVYNIIEGSVIEMKIQKRDFWTKYCKIGSKI